MKTSISILFLLIMITFQGCDSKSTGNAALNGEYLEVGSGIKLFHRSVGSGEPIIVIHGGPNLDMQYFLPHLDALSSGHQLIYFDQRTCGKSSADVDQSTLSLDLLIEDIESVRKAYGFDKVHILAHSFGGYLAMEYALKHQDHIKSLMLISSNPANATFMIDANKVSEFRMSKEDADKKLEVQRSDRFKKKDPSAIEDIYKLVFKYSFKDPAMLSQLNITVPEDIFERSRKFFMMAGEMMQYDITDRLKEINVPTLIVYGDYDPFLQNGGKELARSIKGAQMEIIKDCGHFPFIEKKATFFTIVNTFVQENK